MTRLELFIARMTSQRACIDYAVGLTAGMAGPVYELGLGNGRTFDHIRAKVTDRDIFVFERAVASNPASTPSEDQLVLGDVVDTLPMMLARDGATVSFAHADLGGHNLEKNDAFARLISPLIEVMIAPGGVMVSSDKMYFDALEQINLPEGAMDGRAFIYRKLL